MLVGIKISNWHVQFLRDYAYRLCKIRIIRYEHRYFELLAETVSNEM